MYLKFSVIYYGTGTATATKGVFLEDKSAETTVKSILAKVSGIVKGIFSRVVTRALTLRCKF